ncbi:MAG: HAD-IB family phosphatase [Cardiobacteriaceae bacterium]|nr:HAD-IB family phosphatase [Cardiobacteriaceae bacterium]
MALKFIPDAVAFDCDSTLSSLEGIDELAALAGVREEVASLTDQAMNGDIPLEAVYGKRLDLIRPKRADLAHIAREYLATIVPGARETIAALQARGVAVAIVSGGLIDAILPLAHALGIAEENVFAVPLEFDGNGDYLGLPAHPLATAHGKAEVIAAWKKRHGFKQVVMVGDGMSDIAARAEGAADAVIGYGGVIVRDAVRKQADVFVADNDLRALLPLLHGERT